MKTRISIAVLCTTLLAGCAPPVILGIGGIAAGAAVASDRRTAGTILDDEQIEVKTLEIVAKDPQLRDSSHVNATCFNGQLLLTGEVPDSQSRIWLAQKAGKLPKVALVKNELVVGPVSSSDTRAGDTATTSRVKTRLVTQLGASIAHHVKVLTESSTVYLMGIVDRDEAERAVTITKGTQGVKRIVKVFEYQN